MKGVLFFVLLAPLAACSETTVSDAKDIACVRLAALQDGPSLRGPALCSALQVTDHRDGVFLVELRDEARNLLWAVTVNKAAQSEVSRMAIDG